MGWAIPLHSLRRLANIFPLTMADMLRHSGGAVIAGHFDDDQRDLRRIAHILIAVAADRRDGGKAGAFEQLALHLEAERWTNYLQLILMEAQAGLSRPVQLAVCQLLDQWAFDEARRLGLLLKVSFCPWLAAALADGPPEGNGLSHASH